MDSVRKKSYAEAANVQGSESQTNSILTTQAEREAMRRAIVERSIYNRIVILRNRSTSRIASGDYEGALGILQELKTLQGFEDIDLHLSMAECFYHIPSGIQHAEECVNRLRITVLDIVTLQFQDMIRWGDDLTELGRYCGAIVIYQMALEKYKSMSSHPENWIETCQMIANYIASSVSVMRKLMEITNTVYSLANTIVGEIFNNVHDAVGCNPRTKALLQAQCMYSLLEIRVCAKKYDESIPVGLAAVQILEQHLGASSQFHCVYGAVHHNLSVAYYNQGNLDRAEALLRKALEVAKVATDFPSESSRVEVITATMSFVKKIRTRLKQ